MFTFQLTIQILLLPTVGSQISLSMKDRENVSLEVHCDTSATSMSYLRALSNWLQSIQEVSEKAACILF